jgi:hypothetical protein
VVCASRCHVTQVHRGVKPSVASRFSFKSACLTATVNGSLMPPSGRRVIRRPHAVREFVDHGRSCSAQLLT